MTKFDPHLFFNPVWEKNFDPPTSFLDPPTYKKSRPPHLHFDNSNTADLGNIVETNNHIGGGRIVTMPFVTWCTLLPDSFSPGDCFIQTISIAPLQVHFYSEALPTQHGYCAGVSR